jgi:acyl carrier protein
MESNVQNRLIEIFKKTFELQELDWNVNLTAEDVDGWDSITHLDLIVNTEEEFKIEISGFDVMGLQNTGDLLSLVEGKLEL